MQHTTTPFCIFIALFIAGCDPHDGKLTLVNNTNDTVYYSVAYSSDSIESYPIFEEDGKVNYLFSNILKPNDEHHIPVMDTWEYFINTKCKDSAIRVFFFRNDLIKSASKNSIMNSQLYSKLEKLMVKDLIKLKWRINYP